MLKFRLATLDEVIPLRHEILRKGRPVETAFFPEDKESETRHFGLFDESGVIACCLTIIPKNYKENDAWQLRGMATRADLQGNGVGSQLVEKAIDFMQEVQSKSIIWCNAREAACRFYEKLGWKIDSEKFDIDPIGPHYKMLKVLE
ncbi:GNAT family N-acetyltransferase [bacterium]|nr:MAG: GNAT family N-acetyltransferase [bacterium]